MKLAELARRAGAPGASQVLVESLQPAGVLRRASLSRRPDRGRRLAARAEGQRRGPARSTTATRRAIIVPALPGVHNTKWVGEMTFTRMKRYGASPRTCSRT